MDLNIFEVDDDYDELYEQQNRKKINMQIYNFLGGNVIVG